MRLNHNYVTPFRIIQLQIINLQRQLVIYFQQNSIFIVRGFHFTSYFLKPNLIKH